MILQQSSTDGRFVVGIADDASVIRDLQAMRYQIFALEMGADIAGNDQLDRDPFDDHCQHLYVWDQANNEYVACTRLLNRESAKAAGGFYSQGEFLLDEVLALEGEVLEIGRTCVHKDYRDGSGIALLWQGIAKLINDSDAQYLFGCASVPYHGDGTHISALMQRLQSYYLPEELKVRATDPVTLVSPPDNVDAAIPPLLKAYLRLGAKVGSQACLDEQFGVADVFVLLNTSQLNARYARHFRAAL